MLTGLESMLKKTKLLLEKGERNKLEALKHHLLEACACTKEAKEEAKELVQIGKVCRELLDCTKMMLSKEARG